MTNEKTKATWNFECGEWLSKKDGDKQISRDLIATIVTGPRGDRDDDDVASMKPTDKKLKQKTSFTVTLVTMDKKNAGTVTVKLH